MKTLSSKLPPITDKQKELMLYIYKFRFTNRIQLQKLIKHKDYKRINVWLKDLVTKGYLQRIYERKIPLNNTPGIYYVAPKGVRFFKQLGNEKNIHKLYREKERSEKFRNHSLLITQLYIDLLDKTENLDALNYFHTKVDMAEYENEEKETIIPFPDTIFSINESPEKIVKSALNKDNNKDKTPVKAQKNTHRPDYKYHIELINPETPRFYLKHRIQEYIEYFSEYDEIMRVMFICPDGRTQRFFHKYVKNTLEETLFPPNIRVFLTTTAQIQIKGILSEIWVQVQWDQ